MKKIVAMLPFFIFCLTTQAQMPSDCTVPDELRSSYESDVTDLAFKWLHEIQSPDTSLIEIPEYAKESIWKGLAAIYRRNDFIEIDSVFNKYCIHQSLPKKSIYNIISVRVDTSFAWIDNWEQLQIITGFPSLDSLLVKYGFIVDQFNFLFGDGRAVLTTTQSINILPICDSIESYPGVIYAAKSGYCCDGSTIEFENSGDTLFYTFRLAWGDCPAGCTSSHKWKFKVNPDCSVEFLGIQNSIIDDDYPIPVNCNLSLDIPRQSAFQPNITIFPNPTKDFQTVKTNLLGTISFVILDVYGRNILSGNFREETTLELRNLTNGIYFLMIRDDKRTLVSKKIIIE